MVKVDLSNDEALVLFDLLQRFSDTGSLAFGDQAEKRALWNLCAILEKTLAPFPNEYAKALRRARDRLRDQDQDNES